VLALNLDLQHHHSLALASGPVSHVDLNWWSLGVMVSLFTICIQRLSVLVISDVLLVVFVGNASVVLHSARGVWQRQIVHSSWITVVPVALDIHQLDLAQFVFILGDTLLVEANLLANDVEWWPVLEMIMMIVHPVLSEQGVSETFLSNLLLDLGLLLSKELTVNLVIPLLELNVSLIGGGDLVLVVRVVSGSCWENLIHLSLHTVDELSKPIDITSVLVAWWWQAVDILRDGLVLDRQRTDVLDRLEHELIRCTSLLKQLVNQAVHLSTVAERFRQSGGVCVSVVIDSHDALLTVLVLILGILLLLLDLWDTEHPLQSLHLQ